MNSLAIVLPLFICSGCLSSGLERFDAETTPPPVLLVGNVVYAGKSDYLPRTIKQARQIHDQPSISYVYKVEHRNDSQTGWGFNEYATSSRAVRAQGTLVIEYPGREPQSYSAVRVIRLRSDRWDDWWRRVTFTEMRKNALFGVRNEIEAQMERDFSTKRLPAHNSDAFDQ